MKFHHHVAHNFEGLGDILDRLNHLKCLGDNIMSTISDFAAKQNAFNSKVSGDLDAVATQVTALNALITTLQNSNGTVTPADQATIDQMVAAGTALQAKADALVNTQASPPVVPAA
jgi:pyridoxal biosynthesis lyase PdxS